MQNHLIKRFELHRLKYMEKKNDMHRLKYMKKKIFLKLHVLNQIYLFMYIYIFIFACMQMYLVYTYDGPFHHILMYEGPTIQLKT